MAAAPARETLDRLRKLALLPEEVRRSHWAVSITRLTVLKSLCRQPEVAHRFVTYLARKTLERIQQGKGRSKSLAHRRMMTDALAEMEAWLKKPTEVPRQRLWDLLAQMRDEQSEYENIKWGAVRIVHDWDLLLFERALHCLLRSAEEAGYWVYQTARLYAERSNSSQGSGLVSSSAPLVQDIVDFWLREYDLDQAALTAPAKTKRVKEEKPTPNKRKKSQRKRQAEFTHRQGQFLAFIHLYRQLHRQGPAEAELVRYFRVTPPAVHDMIVRLEERGLVTREPGVPRSIQVAIPEQEIPFLESVRGGPW
jgi:repressor LexA